MLRIDTPPPQVWRPVKRLAIGVLLSWGPWLSAALFTPMPADAALALEVRQQAGQVTIRGSGSANLADLMLATTSSTWTNALTDSEVYAGAAAFNNGNVELWQGLSGPLSISTASI